MSFGQMRLGVNGFLNINGLLTKEVFTEQTEAVENSSLLSPRRKASKNACQASAFLS